MPMCRFLGISVVSLSWTSAAIAQRIELAPIDTPLVIRGWKGDTRGLLGNILLTARDGSVSQFHFFASDLASDSVAGQTRHVIGRDQIDLVETVAERKLDRDVPRNFRVRVSDFEMPGAYTGRLEIRVAGSPQGTPLVIPLRVIARTRPSLAGLPNDTIRLSLVRCRWSCGLATLILPASALQNAIPVPIENPSRESVVLRGHAVVMQGEKTRYRPDASPVVLEPPQGSMFKSGVTTLRLTVDRGALPPDRYIGAAFLDLDGVDQSKRLPIDISVRGGPLLPLLLLLFGILLGRVVKYMQDRGQGQADALRAVRRVEARVAASHTDDASVLLPMVDDVRQAVYAEQLTSVEANLSAITTRMSLLAEVRRYEDALSPAMLIAARPHLTRIRDLVALKDEAKAEEELQKLKTTLANAPAGARTAARAPSLRGLERAAARAAAPPQGAPEPRGWRKKLAHWWNERFGEPGAFRAEVTDRFVRPVLWFLVVFGLALVGLSSLYVDNGATFGASPFADYSGLVFWGLGSDVIGRTLTNLRGS